MDGIDGKATGRGAEGKTHKIEGTLRWRPISLKTQGRQVILNEVKNLVKARKAAG